MTSLFWRSCGCYNEIKSICRVFRFYGAPVSIGEKNVPCTDQQILTSLDTEPENVMASLIDAYSGLLWKVCQEYIENEEDIKDCVNETFSEFYLRKEHFEPEKGNLKGYLVAIARRTAIHCY